MNKNKELVKNTIIIFLGKACTQLISFFLLPLYTAYLTTADYGTVDLIITYVSLLVPVITVQLEMAAFRFLVDNRDNKKVTSKIITNILYCIISFATIFIIGYIILINLIDIPYKWYILLNILVTILTNLMLQISRGLGDNKEYSIGSCIAGIVTVISNVILIVFLKIGAKGMLLSSIIANCMCAIYLFSKMKVYTYIDNKLIDKEFVKKSIKYSLPLVPNGISWWIINVSDRTIISWILGVASNGIYAVSNKFSGIMTSILNIFSLSWTESASLHIEDEDRDNFFSDTINTVLKISLSFALGVIAVMPFVFSFLVNENYNEAYLYIPILMVSCVFNTVVILYSAIYIAKKMTKQVASTSMMSSVINIIINVALIKFIGLYAAAISTALSYLIMAIYRHYDLKKYVNIKYEKGLILKNIIVFSLVMIAYYINNIALNIISLLSVILYAIVINRNNITNIIRIIKEKFINFKT